MSLMLCAIGDVCNATEASDWRHPMRLRHPTGGTSVGVTKPSLIMNVMRLYAMSVCGYAARYPQPSGVYGGDRLGPCGWTASRSTCPAAMHRCNTATVTDAVHVD